MPVNRGTSPERRAILLITDINVDEENIQHIRVCAMREPPVAPLPGGAWGGKVCCNDSRRFLR